MPHTPTLTEINDEIDRLKRALDGNINLLNFAKYYGLMRKDQIEELERGIDQLKNNIDGLKRIKNTIY